MGNNLNNLVSLVKFEEDLLQTMSEGLQLINTEFPSDKPILIKPNLCAENDKTGATTTNVSFTKALIETILKEVQGACIRIIESNSGMKNVEKAFHNLGYTQLVKGFQEQGFDVSLVNLTKEPLTIVKHNGAYFNEVKIPKILLEPKYLISVAKAKCLSMTTITGVLKNQIGCLVPIRFKYHKYLDDVIVDINDILRPDLSIVDAIVGQEGGDSGQIHQIGVVIFGSNPSSVDSVMAQVMGFNPSEIKHLVLAEEKGLGTLDPVVVGASISDVAIKFEGESNPMINWIIRNAPDSFASLVEGVFRLFE